MIDHPKVITLAKSISMVFISTTQALCLSYHCVICTTALAIELKAYNNCSQGSKPEHHIYHLQAYVYSGLDLLCILGICL